MQRSCRCGCTKFRFKVDIRNSQPELYNNICRNCSHTLSEHLAEVRSKQAE